MKTLIRKKIRRLGDWVGKVEDPKWTRMEKVTWWGGVVALAAGVALFPQTKGLGAFLSSAFCALSSVLFIVWMVSRFRRAMR